MKMASWRKSLYSVWISELITLIGFNFVLPFLPYYIQQLGIKEIKEVSLWAGLLVAAPSITLIVSAPLWGIVADKIGRKFMLIRAIFLGTLILFLMGLAKNVQQLFILRLFQGLLTGTIVSANALISSITPRENSGYGFGLIQTSIFAGASIGPLIGGVIVDNIGYRNSFFLSSFITFLAGIMVIVLVKEKFKPPEKNKTSFQEIRENLQIILSILLLIQFVSAMIIPIFPLFIQKLSETSINLASKAGFIIGITGLTASISAITAGKMASRFDKTKFLIISISLGGIFRIMQGFSSNLKQFFLFSIIVAFFTGGLIPVIYSIINQKIKKGEIGKTFGVSGSISAFGRVIGPSIGGTVASLFYINTPFLLSGTLLLLMGVIGFSAIRIKRGLGRI